MTDCRHTPFEKITRAFADHIDHHSTPGSFKALLVAANNIATAFALYAEGAPLANIVNPEIPYMTALQKLAEEELDELHASIANTYAYAIFSPVREHVLFQLISPKSMPAYLKELRRAAKELHEIALAQLDLVAA